MSLELGTHAELDPREPCPGRVLIVDQAEPIWTVECEQCRMEWGLPGRKIDPTQHNLQMIERRRGCSGIPTALQGLLLPIDDSDRSRALRDWATGAAERPGLSLTGAEGRGKTYAAAAAAWERTRFGPLRWVYVPDLFARLAFEFSDDGDKRRSAR